MYLEGDVDNWYIWWKTRNQFYDWNTFKNDFLKDSKEFRQMNFFHNSVGYNKKVA